MTCSKLSPEQEFFTAIIPRIAMMSKKKQPYSNLMIKDPHMKNKQVNKIPNKTKPNLNKLKIQQKNHKQSRKNVDIE